MVGPSNFSERGAMTELPFFTGKLKGVLSKVVNSWNDLEVYSPSPTLPSTAAPPRYTKNPREEDNLQRRTGVEVFNERKH